MNIPTPADPVMEMARKCAASVLLSDDTESDANQRAGREIIEGQRDDTLLVQSALAAIRATTRAAAAFCDAEIPMPGNLRQLEGTYAGGCFACAQGLRANHHIKGSDDAQL